jgi:hypothetical protein
VPSRGHGTTGSPFIIVNETPVRNIDEDRGCFSRLRVKDVDEKFAQIHKWIVIKKHASRESKSRVAGKSRSSAI